MPENRPPATPFCTTPIANETCRQRSGHVGLQDYIVITGGMHARALQGSTTARHLGFTWVEVGPGRHCPRARSSANTEADSHRCFWTNVFSKTPMWAAGPPKANTRASTVTELLEARMHSK
eukprot:9475701-Pyramimonas_sp.AAC.2